MRLTKKDVAVVALAKLGGATRVIETEDAAIAAHAIDRDAFGWKKYPERVDLDAARTTLRHEGEGKEPRIEGSIQNGWHLTPEASRGSTPTPSFLATRTSRSRRPRRQPSAGAPKPEGQGPQ